MPVNLIKTEYFANLAKVHKAFKLHGDSYLDVKYVPKSVIEWFNKQSFKYTGHKLGKTFEISTIYSRPGKSICSPYVMIYADVKHPNTYGITLCYHNTQADTDMSDGVLFTIEYNLNSKNQLTQFSIIIGK